MQGNRPDLSFVAKAGGGKKIRPNLDFIRPSESAGPDLHTLAAQTGIPSQDAAETRELSGQLRLPADLVATDLDGARRAARDQTMDWDALERDAPGAASFVRQYPAETQDDVKELHGLERALAIFNRSWDLGGQRNRLAQLGWAALTGAENWDEIRKAQAAMPQPVQTDGWMEGALRGTGEMLPMMLSGMRKGMDRGARLGLGFGAIAAAAGQAGPQVFTPEEVVTVPAAAMGGLAVGMTSGVAEHSMQSEGGLAYIEFMDEFKDRFGNTMDPRIARAAAFGVGAINAAIEVGQFGVLLNTLGIKKKIMSKIVGEATKRTLSSPRLMGYLGTMAAKYGGYVGMETAQEVGQEGVNIFLGELAKSLNNAVNDTEMSPATAEQIKERLAQVGLESAQTFSLMVAPGVGARTAMGVTRTQEVQKALEPVKRRLDRIGFSKKAPGLMEEYLRGQVERGNLPEQVFLPATKIRALFQADPIMAEDEATFLNEMGIEPAKYLEALDLDMDVALDGAKIGRLLSSPHGQDMQADIRFNPFDVRTEEAREDQGGAESDTGDPGEMYSLEEVFLEPSTAGKTESFRRLAHDLEHVAGYTRTQARTWATIVDSVAEVWGRETGAGPEDFYSKFGFDVVTGDPDEYQGSLGQDEIPAQSKVLYQAAAMYQAKRDSVQEFVDGVLAQEGGKESWFDLGDAAALSDAAGEDFSDVTVALSSAEVRHVNNRRGYTGQDFEALNGLLDGTAMVQPIVGQGGYTGQTYVVHKAEGDTVTASIMTLVTSKNGRRLYVQTLFKDNKEGFENWLERQKKGEDHLAPGGSPGLTQAPHDGGGDVQDTHPLRGQNITTEESKGKGLLEVLEKWRADGLTIAAKELGNVITLDKVVVDEGARGKGMGTSFMKSLIAYADESGKTIALSPSTDFGATSVGRLKKFYKRFGFVENKGRNADFELSESMYRLPQRGDENGTVITDTPEFKAWFGDSVVTENGRSGGKPLVVYHGTPVGGEIDSFDINKRGQNIDSGYLGLGFYFTNDPEIAEYYSRTGHARNPAIYPTFLSIKNPFVWGKKTQGIRSLAMRGEELPNGLTDPVLKRAGVTLSKLGVEPHLAPNLENDLSRALSDELVSRGYDGVISTTHNGKYEYVAFSQTQIKSVFNRGSFDSTDPIILHQGEDLHRGAMFMDEMGRATIAFFKSRNITTAGHEAAHVFRVVLETMATRSMASERVAQDWALANEFVGAEVGQAWTMEQEEKWARAWEVYFMEGRAPAPRLRSLFNRLKRWMLLVYKNMKAFTGQHDLEMTPTIRGVMDRMLATEDEIQAAATRAELEPMFDVDGARPDWLGEEAWAEYAEMAAQAYAAADEAVQKWKVKEYNSHLRRWKADAKQQAKEDTGLALVDHVVSIGGLNWENVESIYGRQMVEDLHARRVGLVKHGAPWMVDEVYTEAGGLFPDGYFEDPDVFLEFLANVPTKAQLIDNWVTMHAKHYEADEGYSADEEVLTDEFLKLLEFEAKALAEQEDPRYRPAPNKHLKRIIREETGQVKVKDLNVSEMDVLRATMQAQARGARKGYTAGRAQGRTETAARQRDRQRIAAMKLKARKDARVERDKILRYFKRVRTSPTIAPGYMEQIENLLAQYDLVPHGKRTLERRKSMLEWVKEQENRGERVNIPDHLIDEARKTNVNEMTLDGLRGLHQAVRNVEKLGRLVHELVANQKYRDKEEAVQAIVDEIEGARGAKHAQDLPTIEEAKGEKTRGRFRSALAELTKMEFLFHALGGWKFDSEVMESLFMPIARAEDEETAIWETVGQELKDVFSGFSRSELSKWRWQRVPIPEVPDAQMPRGGMTKEKMVMVALNSGNAGNLKALMEGFGWTPDQVQAITSRLSEQEWQLVKDVWRVIDSLWPYVERTHRTLTGNKLAKVEPIPVQTPFGTIEGGYFPIVLDRRLSFQADRNAQRAAERMMQENVWRRPGTKGGHRVERKGTNMPPLLSFSVISRHLSDVIHDSTHAAAIRDVYALVTDKRVREAITGAVGREYYDQIVPWLQYVAYPRREETSLFDRAIGHIRRNTTVVMLGWKVTVTLKQFLSYSQTVDELGVKAGARGLASFYSDPHGKKTFVDERSAMMRARRQKFDREVAEMWDNFSPKGWTSDIKNSFFWTVGLLDMAACYPTWLAAYEAGMKKHGFDEGQAIEYADHVVRTTQPAASPKDLASIQRGSQLKKTFTMFYTFFSVFMNRFVQAHAKVLGNKSSVPELVASYFWLVILPSVLAEMINRQDVPDDENWKDYAKAMPMYVAGGVPVVRDMVNTWLTGFDYSASPMWSGMQSSDRLIDAIMGRKIQDRGRKIFRYGTETAAYLGYGFPARQVITSVEGALDLANGKTNNPARLLLPAPRR